MQAEGGSGVVGTAPPYGSRGHFPEQSLVGPRAKGGPLVGCTSGIGDSEFGIGDSEFSGRGFPRPQLGFEAK